MGKKEKKTFTVEERNFILNRDNFQCVICGATDDLMVHHRVPRNFGGSSRLDNGITVCAACHVSLDKATQDAFAELRRLRNPNSAYKGR